MSAAPFKVKAVYEYKSSEPDDLNFPNGQIITVTTVEDDDWYTGSYVDETGSTKEGLFPKNFVEKYEPAIPSRPKRVQPKAETPVEAPVPVAASQDTEEVVPSRKSLDAPREKQPEPTLPASPPPQAAFQSPPSAATETPVAAAKPVGGKPPPPVAEKPSSGSFRDRIAAFNKTAAPPPTPFKPATQNNSTGFIKKPFVAPPPSKNAYVPPARELQPPKIYKREEDPDVAREEHVKASERASEVPAGAPDDDEDAPKPMTLRERMALLQKQQLEQAQRHTESGQKKEKAKRPPKKRLESTEAVEHAEIAPIAPLERVQTDETVGKKSVDFADDEAGPLRGSSKTSHDRNAMATPPPPARELVSDTNDADDSGAGDTEEAQETSTEEDRPKSKHSTGEHVPGAFTAEPESTTDHRDAEPADEDEEEEADDTDEDPEIKRRRELRDRMAKMSGGVGMMGMFGPPGGIPGASSTRQPRVPSERDRHASDQQTQDDNVSRAPPVPLMAMPGMTRPPPAATDDSEEEDEITQPKRRDTGPRVLSDGDDDLHGPPTRTLTDRTAPSVPQDRGLPPPPPRDARAPPPPPPSAARPESHDGASAPPPPSRATRPPPVEEHAEIPRPQSKGGPPGMPPAPPRRPTEPPRLDTSPPLSPTIENKRLSRGPPPIPTMSPTTASPQTRAPPPPPPGQPPSRRNTNDSRVLSSEEETTQYDADYDTDMARDAKHKDALKSHNRDSSLDEDTLTDEAVAKSPISPPARTIPSIPVTNAPRDTPPPLPPQRAPASRDSFDAPRAAPPPIPPPKETDDEEYDPFRYSQPPNSQPSRSAYAPVLASPAEEMEQDHMYEPTPTGTRSMVPPSERIPPAPPSTVAPMMAGGIGRPSMEAPRSSMQDPRSSMQDSRSSMNARRSTELPREHGIIAGDIDLGHSSMWWTQPNTPPPSLQSRQDVLYEIESSTSTKRGGKASTSTDVYVLYPDYSQTTINCTFDASDPQQALLEQKHDRPPPPPRKDQLETASSQFGSVIASAAAGKLNTSVSDGTPQAFVLDLLRPLSSQALMPIGTRSFGALVYANLANTSTQVFDEIRPGDIVTFRNAKFSGKHGPMHQKYSVDAGAGGKEHVAIASEWDGTKKKIRVWEQGREGGKKGKIKEESWRMGDLRSGEVRVWRVMSRGWVGWDSGK